MEDIVEILESRLSAIDKSTLTPLVRSTLGCEAVEVINWEFEQLHGGIAAGTAIYRFSGQGRDQQQTIPWSLILKILRPASSSADVSAWNYYKREADCYQSGLLDDLSGGLAAPRCFSIVEHRDGTCWIWLENIRDEIGAQWSLEHYGIVARHLGQFNGTYTVNRPLPSSPWLSSNWLWHSVEQSAPAMKSLCNVVESPWGRRFLPEEDSDRFFHLWEERARYFEALDHLPQTICHFDIFRRNLFARKAVEGDYQTVAIDWAFVGRGPIGADLNPLVGMSIPLGGVPLDKAQEFEEIALESYLEGLCEVGWQGDPKQVRLGYTAAAIRYMFSEIGRWHAFILDESLHAGMEQSFGMPIGQIFDTVARMRTFFFGQLDEARTLMDILL